MTINQRAEQLRYAIQLFAKTLPEYEIVKIATIFNKWEEDHQYKAGDYCLYNQNVNKDPRVFVCLKDHVSNKKRVPTRATSFFREIGVDLDKQPLYVEPTGIEDAYMKNDIVSFNGVTYKCLQDLTISNPADKPEAWELIAK